MEHVGQHYALMLLAMTFDVSVFFAVISGLALGALLFGHWHSQPSPASRLAHRFCRRAQTSDPEGMATELNKVVHLDASKVEPEHGKLPESGSSPCGH